MAARVHVDRALRAGAWLLLAHAALACSVLVDEELEGKDFGAHEDGGGSQADGGGGGGGSEDGGTDGGGMAGSGGTSGGDAGLDAGSDGGVDGGTDSGTEPTLSVVSTSPDDGATTTYRFDEVQIVLSHDVEAVGDDQLTVTYRESGEAVPGELSTDGDTVTFVADDPMLLAGHYDVVLSSDVTGTDGVALGEDFAFTFAIVAGFPDDADYVDRSDTPGGSDPDVGVDAQGNAIVVWLQRGAGGSNSSTEPWVAHYRHGDGWDTPRALDSADGTAYPPKIAVAPDGTAIAAWTHDPGIAMQPASIMASHYSPSDGWSVPEVLDVESDLSAAAQEVAVGMNANGEGIVVWARGSSASTAGVGPFFASKFAFGDFAPNTAILSNGNPVSGSGRIEADLTADGLGVVGATMGGFGHAVYGEQAGGEWLSLTSEYEYNPVKGMAIALDDDDVAHGGCNAPEASAVMLTRVVSPLKSREHDRADYNDDPHVALAGTRDVIGAWRAQGAEATTLSIWAVTYDHVEDDWELSANDVFPDRTGDDDPSAPDVAAYLDTGAMIAWTSNAQLYTVDRSAGSYGDATRRARVEEDVLPGVRIAASRIGTGVMVWVESDGVNPNRIAAQTFRGEP